MKPIIILVKKFEDGYVTLKLSIEREDVAQLLLSKGLDITLKLKDWKEVEPKLMQLFKVNVVYEFGIRTKIEAWKPIEINYNIEFWKNEIKILPGKKCNGYLIRTIPGWAWHSERIPSFYTIPRVEAWHLFQNLSNEEGTNWSNDVLEYTQKQIENRANIDRIATAKDWEYDVQLGGDVKLRNFQKVSCAFVEATEGKALLALEMGLGKTVISLAYAVKNNLRTLIICPASLKANWCREINKLAKVKPVVYMGATPTNHDLVGMLTSKTQFSVINYDIVGRNFEYTKKREDEEGYVHEEIQNRYLWVEAINMAKFDLIICDESHYIKNTDSNRSAGVRMLKADKIIHMTGTPVLNRPGELWPILTMLKPDQFPSEALFLHQFTSDDKSAKNVEQLKNSLKSIMLRRKQSDVIDDLPPLNRIEHYHELSSRAKKLYDKVLAGVFEKVAAFSVHGNTSETSITNILVQIGRLKQVCAIDKVESTADLATEVQDSMNGSPHNKVLIFSQFKAVAFAISQRLGHEALCFVEKGRTEFKTLGMDERDSLVQQFQNDPKIKYLVVTEKTAKEGHNITKAGVVIFNDLFWTPAAHEQGEGRAYMRVSDPHGITSYYRMVDMDGGGIEEWIWELLAKKMRVIEETVEGVESSRDVSIAMDLINKIKDSMFSRK